MNNEDVHTRIKEQLSAFVDGELDPSAHAAVEAHLRQCADCRAEAEGLRATLGALGGLRAKAPGSFLSDIQNQIRTRSRGRFFARRHLLWGRIPFELASLVMILAMLVYYIVSSHGAPTDVTPAP